MRNSVQAPDGSLEEPDIFHISSVAWHVEPLSSPQLHTSSVLLNDTEFWLSVISYLLFSASHAVLLLEVVYELSAQTFPISSW